MKIKIQSRQTGKSYDIAQELKKDKNAIVLVMTEMMKAVFIETFNNPTLSFYNKRYSFCSVVNLSNCSFNYNY